MMFMNEGETVDMLICRVIAREEQRRQREVQDRQRTRRMELEHHDSIILPATSRIS